MRLRWSAAVAALLVAIHAPAAHAEPAAPQLGSPCAARLAGAMTWLPDDRLPLVCEGRWQEATAPLPVSDRWYSYGPPLKLYGEGRRVASVASGPWTGTPLRLDTGCRAQQYAVVYGTPTVGAPQIAESQAGQRLSLTIVPLLFTVEFSGDCLWQRED